MLNVRNGTTTQAKVVLDGEDHSNVSQVEVYEEGEVKNVNNTRIPLKVEVTNGLRIEIFTSNFSS